MRKLWLTLTLTALIAVGAILHFARAGNVSAPSCESLNVSLYLPGGLSNAVISEGEIFLDTQYSDQEKLQKGQILITPSEGPWLAGIQLTQIKGDEAFFLYNYVEAGDETLCSFQRELEVVSAPPAKEEAFSTQRPELLRLLILQPEELIGHWDMDSFQEILQDVPGGRSSFGQDILFEDSMWATALSYGSENHMFQDIRVYAGAENAIAIFDEEYPAERHVEASETPGELQFQPASQRYIQGCKLIALDTYQCLFKVQQGPYITSIKVPVDGVAVTLQDWEEMSQLIEAKLLAQVQTVD